MPLLHSFFVQIALGSVGLWPSWEAIHQSTSLALATSSCSVSPWRWLAPAEVSLSISTCLFLILDLKNMLRWVGCLSPGGRLLYLCCCLWPWWLLLPPR